MKVKDEPVAVAPVVLLRMPQVCDRTALSPSYVYDLVARGFSRRLWSLVRGPAHCRPQIWIGGLACVWRYASRCGVCPIL